MRQGRRLFTDAWGEEEWQKRVAWKRCESEWFLSLTKDEQEWVHFADSEGMPAEEGPRLAREANDEQEEEQELPDDPKVD